MSWRRVTLSHKVLCIPDRKQVSEIIDEVERLKLRTRRALAAETWRYLLAWAVVFAGAWLSTFSSALVNWYWLGGIPLGIGLSMWLSRSTRAGVARNDGPYWVIGASIIVVNFAAGFLLPPEVTVFASWVVIGFGFAGLAWLDRQPVAAGLFSSLAAIAAVLGFGEIDPLSGYRLLGLIFAIATLITSLTLLRWSRRP